MTNPICSICLSDLDSKTLIHKTICNHEFHDECILAYYKFGGTRCPNCKTLTRTRRDFHKENQEINFLFSMFISGIFSMLYVGMIFYGIIFCVDKIGLFKYRRNVNV